MHFSSLLFGADVITLTADVVRDFDTVGTSVAQWRLDGDGQVYYTIADVIAARYDWVLPNSNAGNYECRWTAVSGTPTTSPGAAGSWFALTSTRTWDVTQTVNPGVTQATFTVDIRRASDQVIVGSALIDIRAELA